MSIIKEIYDTTKDIAKSKIAISNIKNELRDEFILNLKFLSDIDVGRNIPRKRLNQIVRNLEIKELTDFLICPFPKSVISRKKVTQKVMGDIKAKFLLGQDLEETCRRIRHMVRYLKADFAAAKDPKKTLFYIKKYFKIALDLI